MQISSTIPFSSGSCKTANTSPSGKNFRDILEGLSGLNNQENRLENFFKRKDYNLHNISHNEMHHVAYELRNNNLISTEESMLLRTPAYWQVEYSNGVPVNIEASNPDMKVDYITRWKETERTGANLENDAAPAIISLLEKLQSAIC